MAKKRDIEGKRLYHFELSDKNRTVRWVLIVLLLIVAVVSISLGVSNALKKNAGWQQIDPVAHNRNCSHEFVLSYDLGAGEASATAEYKALASLYGQATADAWQIFYSEADTIEGINGMNALNKQPNQELSVAPELYQAFEKLENNHSRALYFGPAYSNYDQVFFSTNDFEAEYSDPVTNPDVMDYLIQVAAYANDPESINLELRGDNRVFLKVSAEYSAFLEENGASVIVDFGWLRNAFVIDYLAQKITEAGFTNGFLSSLDGFTANFDRRGTSYNLDIFQSGKGVATMTYQGAANLMVLRSYSMYYGDEYRYYTYADGRTVAPYVDLRDGVSKTATDQLVTYSTEYGCAELAMAMLPIYAADTLDEAQLLELSNSKIHSIWFTDMQLNYTQSDLLLKIFDTSVVPKKAQ